MRFSIVAALAFAGSALGTPAPEKRPIVADVGNAIAKLEAGLSIPEVTELLAMRSMLTSQLLQDALGVTFSQYCLASFERGTVQAIGEAVAMLEDGLGVTAVNASLDKATGGAITSISGALCVTDIYKALGLA
ncbi:hypothetical protein ACRE_064950 [Hapsidospora chrysogenum ATCC 11550]|uniref:Uncharacterized protein n=1 Tax=Hapsidospora chrysogenum (strain ATCC 11550 / CBS 779.69 / DSM 880 / IAM 14645 / JCM 23072 / IMI 49137) TaxID=857340 RepID=A0A086T094_HAPC1|nr:hypothetical protein ACRE_064950 [Hapsidospora chrysogenum ATCC 11550]